MTLRREPRPGRFIARELGVSAASVSRVLRQAHLSRWRELEPALPVVRYQRERPGELIHLDIKKLGRINGVGHRVTGNHSGHQRNRGIEWHFVHVTIDDAARVGRAAIVPDERADTATRLLETTVASYAATGITDEPVMTENGWAYRSRAFKAACARLGVRHFRTQPYTPRTDGKAESFIQTALREWACASPITSSEQRARALERWLHHYNWLRPHSALHCQLRISALPLDGNNLLRLHSYPPNCSWATL